MLWVLAALCCNTVCTAAASTLTHTAPRPPITTTTHTRASTGYSLPLEGFLYRRPKGKLRLLMDMSTSFDDVWVEELETRVVLPEGAKHIKPSVSVPDSTLMCLAWFVLCLCCVVFVFCCAGFVLCCFGLQLS